MSRVVLQTNLPFPRRQGKVRDVYDLGDRLFIVSTDRISAFDWVMPNGIPDKGKVLTQLSLFWFEVLGVENHFLSAEVPDEVKPHDPEQLLVGRSMVVKKAKVVPFECVVRGYLEGSGWKDYQATGQVCGIELPKGLKQCDRLPEPLFTPSTKAEEGHDQNVSFDYMANAIGEGLATELMHKTLHVYQRGTEIARSRGIIIADTKLEWGCCHEHLILIDEVLTPDSSRFWPADSWEPGRPQASFDKQFVREYLMSTTWDRNSPPPVLPESIVQQTRQRYIEACERITQKTFTLT
ncbi:MAG: phosphoribosylaminoimidazolesuccinocarboxamide synthase [Pirellula sp.]|jgi:phosphoribosylaminoimidazole-succinocarboxamide synthase|nr:phosphoribosylaminoimidazolesuccinocarboxamide synthase [Pirellula sp.]